MTVQQQNGTIYSAGKAAASVHRCSSLLKKDKNMNTKTQHERRLDKSTETPNTVVLDQQQQKLLLDETKVDLILSQLSSDEIEVAARVCYEYRTNPHPCLTHQYAERIVRRYLKSKKGDTSIALENIQKTLKFRQNLDVEGLITAFDHEEGKSRSHHDTADQLKSHLKHQKYIVQGYDKDGRSTLYFTPRKVRGHDMEWTVKEAVYSIERAIASTKSEDHTINAIVDFGGFHLTKHSPPVDIGKQFLTTLRTHYGGQINQIYLVNVPFSFGVLWNIFSPFVGTQTREKINFLKNNSNMKNRTKLMTTYNVDELPNWLVDGGRSNRPFDLDEYVHELAFDEAFDAYEVDN